MRHTEEVRDGRHAWQLQRQQSLEQRNRELLSQLRAIRAEHTEHMGQCVWQHMQLYRRHMATLLVASDIIIVLLFVLALRL
ncbi:MAG: hypothetical protein ACRDU8_04035 [Egibacteraceae bacterium]